MGSGADGRRSPLKGVAQTFGDSDYGGTFGMVHNHSMPCPYFTGTAPNGT